MEKILESDRIETRGITWAQLGYEAGLNVSGYIIQRAIGSINYRKYITYCKK